VQVIFVDPGQVPEEWSEFIARLPARERQEYPFCKKANCYKPPRAHYCASSQRLVLNMDHYCPWVCNTIGFYNRKFFVQFLLYSSLALVLSLVELSLRLKSCLEANGGVYRLGASSGCGLLLYLAVLVDTLLALLMVSFAVFHLYMVIVNTTSIELAQASRAAIETTVSGSLDSYDRGLYTNWGQVFGPRPLYWALPLWGAGPVGDGVSWLSAPSLRGVVVAGHGEGGAAGEREEEEGMPSPGSDGASSGAGDAGREGYIAMGSAT